MIHNTTKHTHAPDGSLTMSELERRDRAWHDEQVVTIRCARCDWSYEGQREQSREEWQRHLAEAHPDIASRPKRRTRARQRADAMKVVAERRAAEQREPAL